MKTRRINTKMKGKLLVVKFCDKLDQENRNDMGYYLYRGYSGRLNESQAHWKAKGRISIEDTHSRDKHNLNALI